MQRADFAEVSGFSFEGVFHLAKVHLLKTLPQMILLFRSGINFRFAIDYPLYCSVPSSYEYLLAYRPPSLHPRPSRTTLAPCQFL